MAPVSPGRIVGIGQASVDVLAVAPRTHESTIELSQFSLQGGGAVATAIATAAHLGVKAAYFGRLSDDVAGRMILDELRELGVDVASVIIEPGKVSPMSIVMIDEQTRRRTIQFTRGNVRPLAPDDIPPTLLDGAQLLLLDGEALPAQVAAAEKARERNITVVLDAAHLGPGMGELLALSDVVIASERFAAEIAPSGEIEDSLLEIQKMGPRVVVVTMGETGAIGLEGDKLVRQNAIEVDVVDRTGAGDVFHGAFAFGVLKGWDLERTMPFANAAAGLACRHLGGRAGIPSLTEVVKASGIKL